jgi:pyruvate dehydrogenase E1 component alpha subunit
MIFMYENNRFAEFTRNPKPDGRIAERAGGFGMPAVTVDGSDFFALYEAVGEAVQRGRDGGGPTAIEAVAERYYGHFEGDAQQYRDAAELASSRAAADPIPRFLADSRCSDLDPARILEIDRSIQALLDAGVERALAADDPTPDQLYTDVYLSYRGEPA